MHWCVVVLVLTLCYEVVARYVFNRPTIWSQDLSSMLGGTIILLGLAYTHRYRAHIRIDIFYARLSTRGKAIIDIIGALLFFPLIIAFAYAAADEMIFAWSHKEVLLQTYWYPPAGPIKTIAFIGFSLLFFQGAANSISDLYLLRRGEPL